MSKTVLVAITGGSGSGKSTLADAICDALGPERCVVMREDNYYLPRARHQPPTDDLTVEQIEQVVNFDAPASKDIDLFYQHVSALKAGRAIDQPVYQFAFHDRLAGAAHRIEPRPLVIVEGVHVMSSPELQRLYDLTVYVDTADDVRLIRRIRRDIARGRTPERVIQQYLRFVRPSHARYTEPSRFDCDLVLADEGVLAVQDEAPSREAVERLAAPLWLHLSRLGVHRP